MESLFTPHNPADLADGFILDIFDNTQLLEFNVSTEKEAKKLQELEDVADMYDMLGQRYSVEAFQSLLIASQVEDEEIAYIHTLYNTAFRGDLLSFSTVKVGEGLGQYAVRAVCLVFNHVTSLSDYIDSSDDLLFHIPQPAIKSIA